MPAIWTTDGTVHTFDRDAEIERNGDVLEVFVIEAFGLPRKLRATFPIRNVMRWDP